jgi:predicted dehydrogenase
MEWKCEEYNSVAFRIAIVGTGAFARSFIPLFKAHPLVDEVALCDLDAAKLDRTAEEFGLQKTYSSLDAVCDSDVDAACIITQNWLHAPQAIQALRADKHVYSAVPTGITVEEIAELVHVVEETGLIYMLGETSYYRSEDVYCRQRHAAGDFGHVVYAEAEYYHDFSHGLYEVMQRRGGERWREVAGSPPMHYPTHSVSQVVSVTGAHMTHVSCIGFVDRTDDGIFQANTNRWGNVFSDETALFKMSDGSACRINEFRRVGHPGVERLAQIAGTEATFEASVAGRRWLTRDHRQTIDLDDLLRPGDVTVEGVTFHGVARVHDVARLPREFATLPTGHGGSHQFLVDDFVRACVSRTQPPNNVWLAARYAVAGLVAHESALQGGELLAVPDFGDPPA